VYLFYAPVIENDLVCLSEEESRHCMQVLRLKPSQRIDLTDGKGNFIAGVIENVGKKQVIVRIENITRAGTGRGYSLHMAVAPTKSIDRFEWFLEKATEIGIDEITPVFSQNSERCKLRTDRLEKVIIAAMKQSVKAVRPQINEAVVLKEFLSKKHIDYQLFIACCNTSGRALLKNIYKPGSNAVILIGPEGDFTDPEVKMAVSEGYRPVSLGDSRLRTETAAIVACHSICLLNQ
jgi:16S rRNA (uracil1498-N3)-methyltransferase